MDEVRSVDVAWKAATRKAERLRDERETAVCKAHAAGYRPGKIAEALEVSPGRVTQIVKKRKG